MPSKTESAQQIILTNYRRLLDVAIRSQSEESRRQIDRAFIFANSAHKGAVRRSGEPYMIHPLQVGQIVAGEIGLGTTAIVAALLHDVVEDTDYTIDDIKNLFGEKVAYIVDGLTKLDETLAKDSAFDNAFQHNLSFENDLLHGRSLQAENFRKVLLTISRDIRVVLIKLADRLHNLRTLDSMPAKSRLRSAAETLYLYAPLAHRLGLYEIKTEMEDLSFKHRDGVTYQRIAQLVENDKKKRSRLINKFSLPISDRLIDAGIKFDISGRYKSIYSIARKMREKNISFDEVYDKLALRIIFEADSIEEEKALCFKILHVVSEVYRRHPDRVRDWITQPKPNGYEALHATVMGTDGAWFEVQIRSRRMNEVAERGVAAHWKYKGYGDKESQVDKFIKRVRDILENPESDALEFLDKIKLDIFSPEILTFTPRGDIKTLPVNSTVLDFAFSIHSELGLKCIGAKVNHRLVPVSHVLSSGDQVEVLTSDKQIPQEDWLDIVITPRAITKLKSHFRQLRRQFINTGQEIFNEYLDANPDIEKNYLRQRLETEYNIKSSEDLYRKLGKKTLTTEDLSKLLKKPNKIIRYWQLMVGGNKKRAHISNSSGNGHDGKKPVILSEDNEDVVYRFSTCCNPIPGDEVIGYRNIDGVIVIHKTSCSQAIKLDSHRKDLIVEAEWTAHKVKSFLSRVVLNGIDRQGLVHELTGIISRDLKVNMRRINFINKDGIFEGEIDLYVHDKSDLQSLMYKLLKIKGVDKVRREEKIGS